MKRYFLSSLIAITGCATAGQHAAQLHSSQERELTVGTVQREIHNGMSQAEVAESLGSPNIVSKDGIGLETWIYDKIASEASYSHDQGGVGGLGGFAATPGSSLLLGLLSGNYSSASGASASTQKTLTVVVKFDHNQRVSSATYHSSKF